MYELFTAVFLLFVFTVPCLHFLFFSKTHPAMTPRLLGVGLIPGRHSERHFVFGSSVVLYDSEFRACWRWMDLLACLIPLLLLLGFLLFSIPFFCIMLHDFWTSSIV